MPEVLIDGFKFSQWAGGRQLLIVESDRLAACVAYCNSQKTPWLHISPYHGYHLQDLDFLRDCEHVTGIHLQGGFASYNGLYQLPRLASLSAIFPHDIDAAALPALSDFSTDWNRKTDASLFRAGGLQRLWLRGYKPKSRDLVRLEALDKLEDLSVILSPISSVRGIGALPGLKKLELSYCRMLEDISPLAGLAEVLEELEVRSCKKIADLRFITVLQHLRKAILSDNASLPSLAFIQQMPRLEFLSFVGTTILDGDMTPCFPLEYAGFIKKRHYSHSPEEVAEIIRTRRQADTR